MVPSDEPTRRVVTAIRCQDIQTGLQGYSVGEFDALLRLGMAARLAIHIRGGDVVDYEPLKQVSHYLFDIPTFAFDGILYLLADVEFVRLMSIGQTIKSIIPTVPYFDDMYEQLGEKAEEEGLNEFEKASIAILHRLSQTPVESTSLKQGLNLDDAVFQRTIRLGTEGSYVQAVTRPSGRRLLISPLYFSENAELFADAVEKYGETTVQSVMGLMRKHPGVPFELVTGTSELGTISIAPDELEILKALTQRSVTQPPFIETSYSGRTHFLFTPPIGTPKIPIIEKEIYEKAMAVIASLRQGQYFGEYRIRWPGAIIDAWLDPSRGKLEPTTLAREQYADLALRKICKLVPAGGRFYSPVFIDLPENRRALELARDMLTTPDVIAGRGFDERAHKAIFSPAEYRESLIGLRDVKLRRRVERSPSEHRRHIEELLELVQKGY